LTIKKKEKGKGGERGQITIYPITYSSSRILFKAKHTFRFYDIKLLAIIVSPSSLV
jgi:hypothetical protein